MFFNNVTKRTLSSLLFAITLVLVTGCMSTQHPVRHVEQWHTLTLSFEGPGTSEAADSNPFTDYRLLVRFSHDGQERVVRGFYAADGNAAHTGADSGNIWQVRFTPDQAGLWTYDAFLHKGPNVVLEDAHNAGEHIQLADAAGEFRVTESNATSPSFRRLGTLYTDGRYYKTADKGQVWLKGGTNSPENLLAFNEFDQTFRVNSQSRDGEASSGEDIHQFKAHRGDWKPGDPVWSQGQGKNIIGMMNYLADMGMNSAYFLTLNLQGDGKDVWPYASPTTYDRFDVSKLEQWNILFSHMQSLGIALHMVVQETENERLLDDGETGPLRQLYFQELIARFGHHPGLIWNLGEENGPAEFSPNAQTDEQRIAMANYLKQADPYRHPVIIHTHSIPELKDEILSPLLGLPALDGLSFQVNLREQVNAEVQKWLKKAEENDQPWAITMDEIGEWMDGAKTDEVDPTHDSLRRHALWGSILAGGAGVEWYFGAHQEHNDLTAEDLRSRHNLWRQTKIALDFFNRYTRFWEMDAAQHLVGNPHVYAFAQPGETYVLYVPENEETRLTLTGVDEAYRLSWFNPLRGGKLVVHPNLLSGNDITVPVPPSPGDWVALIERADD